MISATFPSVDQLSKKLIDKLETWASDAVAMLPNLIIAVLVVVAFYWLSRIVRRLIFRAGDRLTGHEAIVSLLANSAKVAVFITGVFIALGILQLDKTVTSLLAGVGVLGLALGFAFQDIAANFVSGIIIAFRQPFKVNDLVKIQDHFGTVKRITLRATVVRLFTGQYAILPNKDVLQSPIINYTQPGERRVDLTVGVSYGDDLEKAKAVAIAAVEAIEHRDNDRDVEVYFEEFSDSSVNFSLRFWVDLYSVHANFLEARSQAVIAIHKAFKQNGITIPFPIRTLDFGIVGGETLREQLQRPQ